jgi:unsaturated rhamnogalacturonyl hydrolase
MKRFICIAIICSSTFSFAVAQQKGNDATAPLHALQPDYPIPYSIPTQTAVKSVLDKLFHYLDSTTPPQFINRFTNTVVTNTNDPDTNIILKPGDFRLTSYEWGVTYGGMLSVAEVTGDERYFLHFALFIKRHRRSPIHCDR